MEEFTNRLKGMSLASISGVVEGPADILSFDDSEERRIEIIEKLKAISEELFDRDLNSQEAYLERNYKLCDRMLARMGKD